MSDELDKDTNFINWDNLKILSMMTLKYTLYYGIAQTISHNIIKSLLLKKIIKLSDTKYKHSKMVYSINLFLNSIIQMISHYMLFNNNHFSINYFIESMKTMHIINLEENKWTLNKLTIEAQYLGWSLSDLLYLYFTSNRKQMKQQIPHHIASCLPGILIVALNVCSKTNTAMNVNASMSGTISGITQFLNVLLSDNNFKNNKFGIDVDLFYKYIKYIFIITFIYTRTIGLSLAYSIILYHSCKDDYKYHNNSNVPKNWLYKFTRILLMMAAPILIFFQLKWTKQLLTKFKNGKEFWIQKTI